MTPVLLLTVALLLLAGPAAAAGPYYNSDEPGCDGTDPNVFFCDNFERGSWYVTNGDTQGGPTNPANAGWAGTIYAPINPPGAAVCGAGVTPFGNCAAVGATGGTRDHAGGNMAMHRLKTPGCGANGWERCGVSDIYVRWYAKWAAGYQWGNEKNMNITNSDGDIAFADITFTCGKGSPTPTASPGIAVNYGSLVGDRGCGPQNQGNDITIQSGRWYFWEMHVRAGSNALVELWVNDCGTDGKTCGPAPILRTRYTGTLPGNSNGSKIETVWLENWTGIPSTGAGPYWDQIKASAVGPIGFAKPPGTVPPPTTTYQLTTATTGAGAVSGAGSYPSGTVVTPVAVPASGSTFSGWSGDCTGSGACTVTMTGNKNVTATFTTPTTPPPTGSVPPAPSSPTVTLGTTDPSGPTFNVAWPAVTGATSYSYTAGLSDNSANLQGTVTPPNMLLKTPYMANGAAGSGFVCIKSVNAAGSSAEAACNGLTVPAKPAVVPPQLTTGTLTVDAQISRCNYSLTAEPPDASGGWTAQFYRDGSTKVGNPISAAPYKRSVELYAPSHSFSVQFTKTGTVMRSPAVVTRACP